MRFLYIVIALFLKAHASDSGDFEMNKKDLLHLNPNLEEGYWKPRKFRKKNGETPSDFFEDSKSNEPGNQISLHLYQNPDELSSGEKQDNVSSLSESLNQEGALKLKEDVQQNGSLNKQDEEGQEEMNFLESGELLNKIKKLNDSIVDDVPLKVRSSDGLYYTSCTFHKDLNSLEKTLSALPKIWEWLMSIYETGGLKGKQDKKLQSLKSKLEESSIRDSKKTKISCKESYSILSSMKIFDSFLKKAHRSFKTCQKARSFLLATVNFVQKDDVKKSYGVQKMCCLLQSQGVLDTIINYYGFSQKVEK